MRLRVICALILLPPASALAQVPPTPGSVLESLPGNRRLAPNAPAEIIFPDQPGPQVHDRNGRRFQVHAFDFAGNTAFPTWRLKRVLERFLDLELNLYDLNVATDAVTEFYHDRGYTLARAVIPAQKVEDGRVQIVIIEGRIGQVLFSGNKRYSNDFLLDRTSSLQPGTLVTTDKLERDLLLLNDLPGLKVRSTLSPGQEFGTSDILVKVEEKPISGGLTIDNYGRKETGQNRANADIELNNPLGIGDQVSLNGIVTDYRLMRYKKFGYSLPLNNDGLRLSASASEVQYDVVGDFAVLGLDGTARNRELTVQNPYVRSRGENKTTSLAYRETELTQRAFGTEISKTYFRMLTAGYTYNTIGEDASVSNISFMLASNFRKNSSGFSQDKELGRIEVDANHLQPLDRNWDIYLRGNLVFSHDRLPDSEKFSIGGPGSVRSYRSTELRGDSGYQESVEFRRRLNFAGKVSVASFFWDMGTVIFKAPGFADDKRSIGSYGAGFTMYPGKDTSVKLEYALPVNNYRASDGISSRLWVSLSMSF